MRPTICHPLSPNVSIGILLLSILLIPVRLVGQTKPLENDENETASDAVGDVEEEDTEEIEVIEEIEDIVIEEDGFFPTHFDGINAIKRDRGINILTARPTRRGTLNFIVDHRPFTNPFEGKDAFFDFLGLDGSLKIGLAFRYGILDCLDIGVVRLNNAGVRFDTYEGDIRWGFLRQEQHHVDAAIRAGGTWFAQRDAKDAGGGFAQAFIDRIFLDILLVGVGFGFHSSSTNDEKLSTDDSYSGAITGVLEWRMVKWLAWTGEIAASVFGYRSQWPAFSFAAKVLTHRHSFSIIFTNTQFIAADGMPANSGRKFADLVFGFQIIREFNIVSFND